MLTHLKLPEQIRFAQFGAVGLVNSVVGYLVIVAALSLGAADLPANIAGYAVGLTVSFVLNSRWTFRDKARAGLGSSAFKYVLVFCVAYTANLAVVITANNLGYERDPVVHLVGIGVYGVLFFIGAQTFVYNDRRAVESRGLIDQYWPELFMIFAVVAAWLLMREIPVSHDVVWQMWIARQLVGGAELYSDILEINPPLWFWLAVPVEKAAQALGVASKSAIITAVFGYILISQLVVSGLIADFDRRQRATLLAITTVAAIILPITDFAQREHLALIAAIPYSILAARRAERREVHWILALAVGVLAATGLALKHYFVAVPLLLELWLLAKHQRSWKPIRPETLALAGAALLYAAAIYVATPAYLNTIVPMVSSAYFGYNSGLSYQLLKPFMVFWLFAALILVKFRTSSNSLATAAAIAGGGFILSYFLQQKGFNYHAVSATGLLFVSVGSLVLLWRPEPTSLRIIAGTMLLPILGVVVVGPYKNPFEVPVSHLLEQAERGKPVMMLAVNPSTIWPMVEERGYVWPSRHFALWMLTAFGRQVRAHQPLSPEMQEMAREVRAQTVVDLTCNPPDVIIVDDLYMTKARGIKALAFFSEDENFRSLFAHYKKTRIWGRFASYVKKPGWEPVRPASCRLIH